MTTMPDREGWWWGKIAFAGGSAIPMRPICIRLLVDVAGVQHFAAIDAGEFWDLERFEWGARIPRPEENAAELDPDRVLFDVTEMEDAVARRKAAEARAEDLAAELEATRENLATIAGQLIEETERGEDEREKIRDHYQARLDEVERERDVLQERNAGLALESECAANLIYELSTRPTEPREPERVSNPLGRYFDFTEQQCREALADISGVLADQDGAIVSHDPRSRRESATMDEIRFYRANEKPYGAFSNLARFPIVFEGETFPTAEHAYQAGKARKPEVRAWLLAAPTPSLCAMAAHGLYKWDVVDDWATRKLDRMRAVLRSKFEQHPALAILLADTGDARIVETGTTDNAVNRFWGEVNGKGQNMLGVMLMEIRETLRAPAEPRKPPSGETGVYAKCSKCKREFGGLNAAMDLRDHDCLGAPE